MAETANPERTLCPRCKEPAGLRVWHLLPSSNARRVLTCVHCGGHYDLGDGSKMASIAGALLGIGPGVYALGKIIRAGHGSALFTILGSAVCLSLFLLGSIVAGAATLRLVAKP